MMRCLADVRLRAMELEDLDFLYEIENDEDVWNVGVTNVPYSKRILLDYITSASGDIYVDKQVRLIIENEENMAVGIVDLVDFSPSHGRAELGIVVKKDFRGRGYGSAVIDKILDYSKNILHLHQIYAYVAEGNKTCVNLLKNADFQSDMVLKDWLNNGKEYLDVLFFQRFL